MLAIEKVISATTEKISWPAEKWYLPLKRDINSSAIDKVILALSTAKVISWSHKSDIDYLKSDLSR